MQNQEKSELEEETRAFPWIEESLNEETAVVLHRGLWTECVSLHHPR